MRGLPFSLTAGAVAGGAPSLQPVRSGRGVQALLTLVSVALFADSEPQCSISGPSPIAALRLLDTCSNNVVRTQ